MVKKFEKEKTYIFSKERCVEVSGIITESNGEKWYDKIDGVKVEVEGANIGKCWEMLVVPEWCEEVDTEPTPSMIRILFSTSPGVVVSDSKWTK